MTRSRPDDSGELQKSSRVNGDDDSVSRPRGRRTRESGLAKIIPYRNPAALTGYYCGFGSVIFILGTFVLLKAPIPQPNPKLILVLLYGTGGLLALLALVCGIL